MNLPDADYVLTDGAAWIEVKGFAIRIISTDEGIIVDVYAKGGIQMTRKDLELIAAFQVGLDVALFDEWPMPPEHWSKSRREAYEAGYTHGKIRIRELFLEKRKHAGVLDEEFARVAS